jgi:integrase
MQPLEQNANNLTIAAAASGTISLRGKDGFPTRRGQRMTRQSFQQGYVSDPIRSRRGTKFIIRYRVRAAGGNWKHRSETVYCDSKKVARTMLAERISECSFTRSGSAEMTVRDFVERIWKPYLDRKGVKPSTRQGYESLLNRHVLPAIGELTLQEVAPLHVEDFVQQKLRGGMTAKSVRNLVNMVSGIFSLAQEDDLISRSPIRKRHKPSVQRAQKTAWSSEELAKIIAEAPSRHTALFACLALTGARIGEVLALKWKAVDFHRHVLRIEWSLWHGQLVSPKTMASRRCIPMAGRLEEILTEHLEQSAHLAPDDFVFCKSDGTSLDPDLLRRDVLYPVLDRLGLPRGSRDAGFHRFRHSFATVLNQETGDLKTAQAVLGHTDCQLTANVYTHATDSGTRDGVNAVERAIFG